MKYCHAVMGLAAGAMLMLASGVHATPSAPDRQARAWAASCAACHGTDGRGQGGFAALAGREAGLLYQALLEFKNGQRPAATVMHQHAKGYSDDQLKRIAAHFAALAPQP